MRHDNATLVIMTEDGEEIEIGELENVSLSIAGEFDG